MKLYMVKCRTALAVSAENEDDAIAQFRKAANEQNFTYTAEPFPMENENGTD